MRLRFQTMGRVLHMLVRCCRLKGLAVYRLRRQSSRVVPVTLTARWMEK